MTLDPQWHHCRADRTVVRTVRAADFATACRVIGPVPEGHYVISAASHAIGYARPLASDRCRSCGVRVKKAGYDRCELCMGRETVKAQRRTGAIPARNYSRTAERTRSAKRKHERKPDRRAAKTAWQRAKRAAMRGEAA